MERKKEMPAPFIEEVFPMPEYEEIKRRLRTEPDLDEFIKALEEYKKKLKDEGLSSRQRKEYAKIVRYLERSISRKDPRKVLKTDEEFLRDKFGTKLNV